MPGQLDAVAQRPGHPDVSVSATHDQPLLASRTLEPDVQAGVELLVVPDCPARYADPNHRPEDLYSRVVFTLPGGGGSTTVAAQVDVLCGLYVEPTRVPAAPAPPPPPALAAVRVALELPGQVLAGTTLRYVVDLTNPTDAAIPLDSCPDYLQAADDLPTLPNASKLRQLNCDIVHALPAHGTVRYAMHLPVRAESRAGPTSVVWQLALDGTSPEATGSVDVVRPQPPCQIDQLALTIPGPATVVTGKPSYNPKGQSSQVVLVVTNRAAADCTVGGKPVIILYDEQRRPIAARDVDDPTSPGPVVVLAPGGQAAADLYWHLGCGPAAGSVRVLLPGAGPPVVVVPDQPWGPPPTCFSPGAAGELAAEPLTG